VNMIAYIDKPPIIEPHNGGFLVTLRSGEAESQFLLTLHAMTGLCSKGMLRVKEAQTKAAAFEPTPRPTRRKPKTLTDPKAKETPNA